jgi:hypothetical protein
MGVAAEVDAGVVGLVIVVTSYLPKSHAQGEAWPSGLEIIRFTPCLICLVGIN